MWRKRGPGGEAGRAPGAQPIAGPFSGFGGHAGSGGLKRQFFFKKGPAATFRLGLATMQRGDGVHVVLLTARGHRLASALCFSHQRVVIGGCGGGI